MGPDGGPGNPMIPASAMPVFWWVGAAVIVLALVVWLVGRLTGGR